MINSLTGNSIPRFERGESPMPSLQRAPNVPFCTSMSCQQPQRPQDTPQVGEHRPLYPSRKGWLSLLGGDGPGRESRRACGVRASGGRGGPTGLNLSFPEPALPSLPPASRQSPVSPSAGARSLMKQRTPRSAIRQTINIFVLYIC